MKNKGFTLIELLVVMAIIGLMGTIVTISLTKSYQDAKKQGCKDMVKRIEDGTCVYVSLANKESVCTRDNCNPIALKTIVEAGFVKEDFNACTDKPLEESYEEVVTVNWTPRGEKVCCYKGTINYERDTDDKCN